MNKSVKTFLHSYRRTVCMEYNLIKKKDEGLYVLTISKLTFQCSLFALITNSHKIRKVHLANFISNYTFYFKAKTIWGRCYSDVLSLFRVFYEHPNSSPRSTIKNIVQSNFRANLKTLGV